MLLEKNTKFLLFGDSVTDMNRKEQGEGLFEAIGVGYPADIQSFLATSYPDYNIRVINKGISGNTSRDLVKRFDTDVAPYKPENLLILIGINDVWRQFDTPLMTEEACTPEEYEANLEWIIDRSRDFVKQLILVTPYYIEENTSDRMRARMDEYSAIVRKLAEKHGAIFVDMQAAWVKLLKYYHSSYITWDRIHPNSQGALYMAKTILNRLDFDYNREI
ncbi:MAG: SGNH/GDSL hydrolase family protein [Clostridia bacterium]|nr:SGNH/GDSL hydrolase family protein [Clostridia bacterium]